MSNTDFQCRWQAEGQVQVTRLVVPKHVYTFLVSRERRILGLHAITWDASQGDPAQQFEKEAEEAAKEFLRREQQTP
jgi:hypothetical protein